MHTSINFLIRLFTQLDPQLFTPLKNYVGKTVEIKIQDFNQSLFFRIEAQQILFQTGEGLSGCDILLSGDLFKLIRLGLSKQEIPPAAVFQKYGITVEGDVGILGAIQEAWQHHEVDWEGYLARFFGDLPALALSKCFRTLHHWFQSKKMDHNKDLVLFLQEEIKLSPSPYELAHFYDAIDTLQEDLDRLEKKIETLDLK